MKILTTIVENWFTLLQSAGIVGSLLLGTASFRDNTRARRAETFLQITSEHRQLWGEYYRNPKLGRVRQKDIDLVSDPISAAERRFVQSVTLHANAVFQAKELGSLIEPEGLREDVKAFFSLPIPSAVYEEQKPLLDRAFAAYIDAALA